MELNRSISRWGNSAGILLPKEWAGKEARVILIDRTLQIREEVLNILGNYLEKISGIYLVGSYARREQTDDSDIDVIAISTGLKKEIVSGIYHISLIPLETIKKTIEKNPLSILPRLNEAETILNKSLLEEIKYPKLNKKSFNAFIDESKSIIKINEKLLEMNKYEEKLESSEIIYSLMLRLRGIFLIKNLLKKEKYSNKEFLKYLSDNLNENPQEVWQIYKLIKNNKKPKIKISLISAKKLLNLLKEEIKKW